MYTLLIATNLGPELSLPVLHRACEITKTIMPTMGSHVTSTVEYIPELQGGYFCTKPQPSRPQSLITTYRDDRHLFLVFGEIYDPGVHNTAAQCVHESWQAGHVEAVRRLNGSFSAIIADLIEPHIYIVCDLFGRRSLRYFQTNTTLLASTHDLPIVATGLCPIDHDLHSACSIVACDWSLEGRSLVRQIKVCNPRAYLQWNGHAAKEIVHPVLAVDDRIEHDNHKSCRRHVDGMIEHMKCRTRRMCSGVPKIRIELTAGLDSRAVLGIVLSTVDPEKITAYTAGDLHDLDVRVAQRIAYEYCIPHERWLPAAPSPEVFLENCAALAFFTNGDTNSKRAIGDRITYNYQENLQLGGGGGGLFRGAYYPRFKNWKLQQLTAIDAFNVLQQKLPRITTLPWKDQLLSQQLLEHLSGIVMEYAQLTHDGHDILDMFSLFERFGRWALGTRMPNEEHRYFLYESADLITHAYQLPAPIAYHCPLQETIIKRLLGRSYWIPINGFRVIPLESIPGGRRALRYGRALNKLARRCFSTLRTQPPEPLGRSLERIQAELLAGPLGALTHDILMSEGSFGLEMFGKDHLEEMIESHRKGLVNQLQPLGFLITLEQWKSQIREARTMAVRLGQPHASNALQA